MPQYNFEAIGTKWQIDIYQNLSPEAEQGLLARVRERIETFDKGYSRFRADSLVTKMSRESGTFTMPEDAQAMLALYRDLYDRTGGLFTPLVGNLLSDAGYDATYSLRQKKELEKVPLWDDVIEYKHPNLEIKKPVMLDFGAAGKGYLIDLVAEVLATAGIGAYCIDAGGDILYQGDKPLRIGLEDPQNFEQAVGIYELAGGSLCGSAGNRRAWGNFNHIMNPKTLASTENILAVWAVAQTALLADALATCLFFVPASTLGDAYDFEYLLVRSDRSIEKSAGFKAELFMLE